MHSDHWLRRYRLSTNIIHPPLLGFTVQVSPFSAGEMEGGVFAANTAGIDHYAKFGHRNALQSESAVDLDFQTNPAWIKVRKSPDLSTSRDNSRCRSHFVGSLCIQPGHHL
jgi:hypothetical protein